MDNSPKWATIAVALICAALALYSATLYPVNSWGLLELIAYEGILLLLLFGVLYLVYNRALQN
jgi:amino acid transporter